MLFMPPIKYIREICVQDYFSHWLVIYIISVLCYERKLQLTPESYNFFEKPASQQTINQGGFMIITNYVARFL